MTLWMEIENWSEVRLGIDAGIPMLRHPLQICNHGCRGSRKECVENSHSNTVFLGVPLSEARVDATQLLCSKITMMVPVGEPSSNCRKGKSL